LPFTEPGGSPAAARQFGDTTGFGGSWLGASAALPAAALSLAAGAVGLGGGSEDAAALGAVAGRGGVGAAVAEPGVGARGAGIASGAAAAFGARGAAARRSPCSCAGVSRLGAPVAISHTDIRPKVKPTVRPANKMAAAANVRRRTISGSLCI
jgi:hypothetical protein